MVLSDGMGDQPDGIRDEVPRAEQSTDVDGDEPDRVGRVDVMGTDDVLGDEPGVPPNKVILLSYPEYEFGQDRAAVQDHNSRLVFSQVLELSIDRVACGATGDPDVILHSPEGLVGGQLVERVDESVRGKARVLGHQGGVVPVVVVQDPDETLGDQGLGWIELEVQRSLTLEIRKPFILYLTNILGYIQ